MYDDRINVRENWVAVYECGHAFEMYPEEDPYRACEECGMPFIDGYSLDEYEKFIQ